MSEASLDRQYWEYLDVFFSIISCIFWICLHADTLDQVNKKRDTCLETSNVESDNEVKQSGKGARRVKKSSLPVDAHSSGSDEESLSHVQKSGTMPPPPAIDCGFTFMAIDGNFYPISDMMHVLITSV